MESIGVDWEFNKHQITQTAVCFGTDVNVPSCLSSVRVRIPSFDLLEIDCRRSPK